MRISMMILVLFSLQYVLYSQEQLLIPRIQGEIKFDGKVDDPCWINVQPISMVMHTPVFGSQPSEKSEIMFCYDDNYLYIGARLFDSDASAMLVSSKKRDEAEVANEALGIILDSFNDKENGLGFATTPTGLRTDFTISKDAISSDPIRGPMNISWNTFWDVKTTVDESGWFSEIRIPFSSIRFKVQDGKAVMGLICMRMIAHKNETDIFPAIPPNWGDWSVFRPSKAQEVVFEGLVSRKPFYIAPYLIGGFQQEYLLNSDATSYELERDPRLTGGLDVKYGLTNNLTLDLTLNTDFAQVEADDEQINLTRFSLFFPEKRTFFQERSSIFTFDFEPQTSLFYSRRIGLYEGDQVPIIGGARVTGMAGRWDLGFLDMQTRTLKATDGSKVLASENFGILRVRRQIINENSYAGGIITSRVGTDGSYNTAIGLDGIFKFFENDYLNVKWVQTLDNTLDNNKLNLDQARIHFNWYRFNNKGLSYALAYGRSGKFFDPKMGFQSRTDYSHYYGGIGYGWIPGESSKLLNHKLDLRNITYFNNSDNSAQSIWNELSYEFRFKSDYSGMMSFSRMFENVTDTFSFSRDAEVPAGKYAFYLFETHLNSPQTNRLVLGADFFTGSFYDGTRYSFGLETAWMLGSTLQLSLNYDHNILNFKERGQSFSGGVAGFKALVMFTTKLSFSTFVQYNGTEHDLISNFRFRYNPREGNDLYIVVNEGRSTFRDLENPRLPVFNSRSVLLKYTYTFTL